MLTKCVLMVLGVCTQYAEARHGYHHHHHTVTRHATADLPRVSHLAVDTTSVEVTWPYVEVVIRYPDATGTTVLDQMSGREPVISRADCAYLGTDWYRMRHEWGWMHPQ